MAQTAQGTSAHPHEATLSRHHRYWISGGDLHFLVRRTRFRVHSYFFTRESSLWKGRIALSGDSSRQPGTHETTAFVLDEDPEDFARFLWVFYNPRYGICNATLDQWITILRLATTWEFPNIREFAISYINALAIETIDKVKIYQEYHVPRKYLLPLLLELATRDEPLEREEFRAIDVDSLYLIISAREMLRTSRLANPARRLSGEEKLDIVVSAFDITPLEIEALRDLGEDLPSCF
ncbi:hypothetical protein P691DRAFT_678099 [Macrolepiota fuliginosa MF-IS2]|uniref:BTB domain-containing protein n=1 Tax=Macrolepiota fuliginosa MF-IS2 TaxID=1400762 RepID=A0A9P5X5U4_9AGAR|nr:hypothetical protein P691DRAFT_678099 [Macrolepiota fuliginosa MF-IS2]